MLKQFKRCLFHAKLLLAAVVFTVYSEQNEQTNIKNLCDSRLHLAKFSMEVVGSVIVG